MALSRRAGEAPTLSIFEKLTRVNWGLLLLLTMIAGIGFAMLYSAGNGNWDPWASRQMVRYGIGFTGLLIVALIDIRFWIRYAYFFYLGALILLGIVEGMGAIGMGARRWIDLGIIQLQPSEVMKIALILALARYFHAVPLDEIGRIRVVLFPLLLLVMPVVLVLRQPDLGTAIVMVLITGVVIFAAGIRIWKFALAGGVALAAIPIAWPMLHEYQRQRVLTFIDPSRDPLGAGYHITQSKIALGSGGTVGRGFMQGTQSHLSFLPERHTDFIFTMICHYHSLCDCHSRAVEKSVRPLIGHRRDRDIFDLYHHQRRHGDRVSPGRWCAAAIRVLWWNLVADLDGRIRFGHLRQCAS
jgi:rod shape determining protein RodA